MPTGTVRWFNAGKGFGFIARDEGGADVFSHRARIRMRGYRVLQENQKVGFDPGEGSQGPQAENIGPL